MPTEAIADLSLDDKGDRVKEETIPDMDDIPDMEDMDEGAGLEDEDEAALRIVHPDRYVARTENTIRSNGPTRSLACVYRTA